MISLIIGPMFSGKTTEMLRQTYRHVLSGKKAALVKYSGDTRFSTRDIITHHGVKLDLPTFLTGDLFEIVSKVREYQVIAIDECQFMKNLVMFCDKLASSGKIIICAGLDSDFKRNPFNNVISLVPKAEKIKKLQAVCSCGGDASFSKILIETDKIENIGGKEMYEPMCRKCYNK